MALYQKYRPQNFADVVGQEHVVNTLQNSLKLGKISHAYLFSGPRGTGKTSLARILAKAINCTSVAGGFASEPCGVCLACKSIQSGSALDVIEIDAASNTSVDNIRDLREKANFQPSLLKFKVYIIDEVHMLSKSAFNALLKTLEEPPQHVIFILATTEAYDVPVTVLSRCQRYDFRLLTLPQIKAQLVKVTLAEQVKIDELSLELIARLSNGALRDSLSIVEQVLASGQGEYSYDAVVKLLGILGREQVTKLWTELIGGNTAKGLDLVSVWHENGTDLHAIVSETIEYLRQLMIIKVRGQAATASWSLTTGEAAELLALAGKVELGQLSLWMEELLRAQYQMRRLDRPMIAFELALVKRSIPTQLPVAALAQPAAVPVYTQSERHSTSVRAEDLETFAFPQTSINAHPPNRPARNPPPLVRPVTRVAAPEPPRSNEPLPPLNIAEVQGKWAQVLLNCKPFNHSVEAVLRGGSPKSVDSRGYLVLEFKYSFHKEKIEEITNRTIVEKALEKTLGKIVRIQCVMVDGAAHAASKARNIAEALQHQNNDAPESVSISAPSAPPISTNNDIVMDALRIFPGASLKK